VCLHGGEKLTFLLPVCPGDYKQLSIEYLSILKVDLNDLRGGILVGIIEIIQLFSIKLKKKNSNEKK
jgi:hypothetical protein